MNSKAGADALADGHAARDGHLLALSVDRVVDRKKLEPPHGPGQVALTWLQASAARSLPGQFLDRAADLVEPAAQCAIDPVDPVFQLLDAQGALREASPASGDFVPDDVGGKARALLPYRLFRQLGLDDGHLARWQKPSRPGCHRAVCASLPWPRGDGPRWGH